jgi:hypothetical protein
MNIVKLIIGLFLVLSVLYFLLPWVSKKIEEPFQGSSNDTNSCAPKIDETILVPAPIPSEVDKDLYKQTVEYGRQVFNKHGFLQPLTGRAFEGQLSDEIKPGETESPLTKLNTQIKLGLQNIDVMPDSNIPDLTTPTIEMTYDKTTGIPILKGYDISNKDVVSRDALRSITGTTTNLGYVEEQLPPKDPLFGNAAKCENVSLNTTVDITGAVENRPTPFVRKDLCSLLDTKSNELAGTCGICIKNADPLTIKERPFVGGMYIREANPAQLTNTPTAGTCAPGYFFVRGQKTQCEAAIKSIECEEYGTAGGFSNKSLTNPDNNCVACIQPNNTVEYIYNDPIEPKTAPNSIRVRIVVPSGTGRNLIRITPSDSSTVFTYNIFPTTVGATQMINSVNQASTNCIFFNMNIDPSRTLQFEVFQEYPHRPRGAEEVFLVQLPNYILESKTDVDKTVIESFVSSIGCQIATYAQMKDISQITNVCGAGYVRETTGNLKGYTANSEKFGSECKSNPTDKTGLIATTTDENIDGVWCYGIKPLQSYLAPATIEGSTIFDPKVANFFVSNTNADKNTFSRFGIANTPCYRGILVQLEEPTAETANVRRAVEGETFMITVGQNDDQTMNAKISESETREERLTKYVRNGLFENSMRIVSPKSSQAGANIPSVLSKNYWIWGNEQETPYFTFSLRIPGYFKTPTYANDAVKCAVSPLYSDKDMFHRVRFVACETPGPTEGSLSDACIQSVFQEVGGSLTAGHLSPLRVGTGSSNTATLRYENPTTRTGPRSLAALTEYLTKMRDVAVFNKNGQHILTTVIDFEQKKAMINEAALNLFGTQAANPCEEIAFDIKQSKFILRAKEAPLDAQCLDYLYKKTGTDSTAQIASLKNATYSNIGDKYSFTAANEKQACQPSGTWAPINPSGQISEIAVSEINKEINTKYADHSGLSDIEKAIRVFNDVYTDANTSTDIEKQTLAIERCYGVSKKKYTTNCDGVLAYAIRFLAPAIVGKAAIPADFSGWQIKNAEGAAIMPSNLKAAYTHAEATTTKPPPVISAVITLGDNVRIAAIEAPAALNGLIIQLLDNGTPQRVLVQKALTGTTLDFNSEDARPLIPYSNLQNVGGELRGIGKRFRFESAVFPGYMLQHDGTVGPSTSSASIFELDANVDGLSTMASPIYSLYQPGIGKQYFCRSNTNGTLAVGSSKIYGSWAILPSMNQSAAHINIQSANQTSQYLIVQKVNTSADTAVRVDLNMINGENEYVKEVAASWKLIPAE